MPQDNIILISQLLLDEINKRFDKEPLDASDIEWSDNFAIESVCSIIEEAIK